MAPPHQKKKPTMINLVGSGTNVQAETEALKQATQQDNTSVQSSNPGQESQQPMNAVRTADDAAREVIEEATPPNVNAGLSGEHPDKMDTLRGTYLDISA